MAQTKAKTAKSSGSSKARTRAKSASRRSSSSRKPASQRRTGNSHKPHKPAPVEAVGNAADKATTAVGKVADRAKIPLVAGGAAIAGAAGGLVLGTRHARRRKGMAIPRRPQVKVDSGDIAKAAKEVGSFGAQLGHLATELQRAREDANGGKHRSPVEVVLEGLTARRSRA